MSDNWEMFVADHPKLSTCTVQVQEAFDVLLSCVQSGKKILTCGNGGSAADSEHIVGELMKGFTLARPVDDSLRHKLETAFGRDGLWMADHLQQAIPAISLVSQTALMTAFLNDVDPAMLFAQQVLGYGKPGDCLIALSTSGNSPNVVNAVRIARVLGMKTIGMTGESGGKLKVECDVCICAPAKETARVQEYHQIIYHHLSEQLEVAVFGEE